jgi:hypothetical protein
VLWLRQKKLFGDYMIKNIGYVLVFVAFFVFILLIGEIYLLRMEVQGAFDRSVSIATDESMYYESPDLPIDSTEAWNVFQDLLADNLILDSMLQATLSTQKVRSVTIEEFNIFNVYSPTQIVATNPLTGADVITEIDRPSIQVLGIVELDLAYWPTTIQMPIYAVSSGHNPD